MIRLIATISFVVALIIFWSIPVAIVGGISNVNSLANSYDWLHWILDIPGPILGLLTGLLPSVLLAVLMSVLPIVLRRE